MIESDQLDILSGKIESVLDWSREELDVTLVGIVGVLDSLKFEILCENIGSKKKNINKALNKIYIKILGNSLFGKILSFSTKLTLGIVKFALITL